MTRPSVADPPVVLADRVGAKVIDAVPQRLATAKSEAEREAIFRLRYETVIELGWAQPDELPDGLERSPVDDESAHVGAWEGDELVGAARVVFPVAGRPLPIEEDFGVEARAGDVEVGRTVIVPRLRGGTGHALTIALFAQCWTAMRSRGHTELLSAVPPELLKMYRSIGFTVAELGGEREHWGERRAPVRFDVLGSAERLWRLWGDGAEKP